MDVAGQCYSEPCLPDSPAVTTGLGFATAIASFVFICQVRVCTIKGHMLLLLLARMHLVGYSRSTARFVVSTI